MLQLSAEKRNMLAPRVYLFLNHQILSEKKNRFHIKQQRIRKSGKRFMLRMPKFNNLRKNNSKNITEFSVISRIYLLLLPPVNLPLS